MTPPVPTILLVFGLASTACCDYLANSDSVSARTSEQLGATDAILEAEPESQGWGGERPQLASS
jgi:hypothetical protein